MTMRRLRCGSFASAIGVLATLGTALVPQALPAAPHALPPADSATDIVCDLSLVPGRKISDYRLRESTTELHNAAEDVHRNHYELAARAMRQGYYGRPTKADIVFMLNFWPN